MKLPREVCAHFWFLAVTSENSQFYKLPFEANKESPFRYFFLDLALIDSTGCNEMSQTMSRRGRLVNEEIWPCVVVFQ